MPTRSYWRLGEAPANYPRLISNLTVDAVVVGGGNTGIMAAYLMKQAGLRVALLERDQCCGGDTGHTSAHLTFVTDRRLSRLVKDWGHDHARAAWEAGDAAIQCIEERVQQLDIDCDYLRVPGYLCASLEGSGDERQDLHDEVELANSLGFSATYLDLVPMFNRPGMRIPNQARIHPLKFLRHILDEIPGDGSYVFEHTEALSIEGDPPVVAANGREVAAKLVFIATDVPLQGKSGTLSATLLQTKIMPYTSYVVGAKLPLGMLPDALFWDTSDPYYFLRIDRRDTHDYVIFGGADHKTGQATNPESHFDHLERVLQRALPDSRVNHRWSGQVIESVDGLPYIGETAPHQFIATGFAGNGLTFGTVAAMMACDAATGRKNPWQELFQPRRKKLTALWDYVKENIDYPYYMVKDRLTRAEAESVKDVPADCGKLLKLDGKRLAVYRNAEGEMTALSPVCTHLGCIVHWNGAEKTWDCPCHGSRFRATGEVLAGPAETPLTVEKISNS